MQGMIGVSYMLLIAVVSVIVVVVVAESYLRLESCRRMAAGARWHA